MKKATNKKIAVIECTDAGGIEIGMAILQMGYTPLFLLNPDSYKGDLGIYLQHYEFLSVDTTSDEAIINVLEGVRDDIAGITTLVDSRLAITALVAQKLGLFGPDQACIALKDKAEVVKLCPEYSLKTIDCTLLLNNEFDVKELSSKSYVAKMKTGCGAVGIRFLQTNDEKRSFCANITNPAGWILQEYFEGSLFSMEGWIDDNGIHYLGWTSRKKIKNTETEFRFEGFNTVSDKLTDYAKKAIEQLFHKSSFKRGWFHIEFLINSDHTEAVMIDANVGRTGGAMLPHVLSMALSVSATDIYQHAIETQLFGMSTISMPVMCESGVIYKCICFGSGYTTIIDQIILPEYPLKNPGLRVVRILGAGDRVNHMGTDDWAWVGFVAGAEKEVDHYVSGIQLKSHSGSVAAVVY